MSAEKLNKTVRHLNDRELAAALVDRSRLSPEARKHLAACPVCAAEVDRFGARLDNLGRKAREQAPRSLNRFRWARPEPALRSFFLRPSALAAGGLLVFALVAVWGLNIRGPEEHRVALNEKTELSSVEASLEEGVPLSAFHSFVIGQDTVVLSDDFMEFVADPLESI